MKPVIITLILLLMLISCINEGKQIAFVNSYHKGYQPSDKIMKGVEDNLPPEKYNLKYFFIDSKRLTSEDILAEKVDSIKVALSQFKPDLIIASDDYAVKYLVRSFYNNTEIPVVFCGVNWSASQYELSGSNITGMIEVLPIPEALGFMKHYYSGSKKLAILSENSLSELNNKKLLDTLYKNLGFEPYYYMADDFQEWKEMFILVNEEADIIYLPTNGAIRDWNREDAISFVETNIKKPLFTCDDFMMEYCVAGFVKVPEEQGIWAAETTERILSGTPVSDIPYATNRQFVKWLNLKNAQKIGFDPGSEVIKEFRISGSDKSGN